MSLAQVQAYVGEQAVPLKCEGELIERAKVDPEAFARLYRKHRPVLLDHVYRRTGDVHVTEDLVADVFLEALRSLPGYRYRGVPLRFWLLRIATHAVNRWGRRHRRKRFALLQAERLCERTVSSTIGEADGEHVRRALLELPPRYQAVLALYYFEGLSVKETATVIGCREGTVRSRLARAREALRRTLIGRR